MHKSFFSGINGQLNIFCAGTRNARKDFSVYRRKLVKVKSLRGRYPFTANKIFVLISKFGLFVNHFIFLFVFLRAVDVSDSLFFVNFTFFAGVVGNIRFTTGAKARHEFAETFGNFR